MKKREIYRAIKHPEYLKFLRIMKLTAALILFACLQLSARTYSQDRITLNLQSTDLKKVLAAIEKKSTYRFLYNDALLAGKPKVDENNLVVLKASADHQPIEVMDKTITGRVIDANGQPLPGVSVTIKGTQFGATTNTNGDFSIVVPDDKAVLVFSYVGYDSQETTVGSRASINVTLQTSTRSMDQVVVIGYGTA